MAELESDLALTLAEVAPPKPPAVVRKRPSKLTAWVTPDFDAFDLPGAPPPAPRPGPSRAAAEDGAELLTERFRPRRRAELCVHARKVAEVDAWLRAALDGSRGRLLLLTGPPGCGKTATVRCVCAERRADLREWSSALGGREEQQLEEFLFRADRYDPRAVVEGAGDSGRSVLLLEDLPPAAIDRPELLQGLLRRHATSGRWPLVLVLSDSPCRSLSPRWLLPKAAMEELGVHNIRFNPVAPTQMKKALQRVADSEMRRKRCKVRTSTSEVVSQLVLECGGDIRCALNRLQFFLAQPRGPPESKKLRVTSSESEEQSRKDDFLCLFRALGKVLHCKRLTPAEQKEPSVPLPPHLSHHRRLPLAFDPEEVFESSRLPGPLFAAFLHENCPDFFADIGDLSEALSVLSLADVIGAHWAVSRAPGAQLSDLYVGPLAVRGVAFAKRRAQPVGFRPLRRPQLLSLPHVSAGTAPRDELLDLRPFRRVLANRGRPCAYSRTLRGGGSLYEHDSAFEETSGVRAPGATARDVRTDRDGAESEWTIVTTADEQEDVVIEDWEAP